MRKVKAACIQMDVKLGEVEANMNAARSMIQQSADQGADFAVLPEMWLTGYSFRNLPELAGQYTQEALNEIAEIAQRLNIHIIGGSFPELEGERVYNTAYAFDRSGRMTEKYRKIHLFSYTGEERWIGAGDKLPDRISTQEGSYGITICYDIRFPEIFRPLGVQGAEMIFVPAQLPHPRLNHWRVLLQARAIENQSFIIGCNRVGTVKKLEYFGHSMIIDPWGEILAEGDETEGIVMAELDLDLVADVRGEDDRLPGSSTEYLSDISRIIGKGTFRYPLLLYSDSQRVGTHAGICRFIRELDGRSDRLGW